MDSLKGQHREDGIVGFQVEGIASVKSRSMDHSDSRTPKQFCTTKHMMSASQSSEMSWVLDLVLKVVGNHVIPLDKKDSQIKDNKMVTGSPFSALSWKSY